jgi:hypothetical protein
MDRSSVRYTRRGAIPVLLTVLTAFMAGCQTQSADSDDRMRQAFKESSSSNRPLPPEARKAMEAYLQRSGSAATGGKSASGGQGNTIGTRARP